MNNILTTTNLVAGIVKWKKKNKWDRDFHNNLYKELRLLKANGLNGKWWAGVIDHLSSWRAIRPYPKLEIYERGKGYLGELQKKYLTVLELTRNEEPDNEITSWETLSGLFRIAAKIKYTMPFSPVFASKLCHFIFPGAYSVVDSDFVGINRDYKQHWVFCSTQWNDCRVQQELISVLHSEIRGEVFEYYPWSTKITELCIAGKKHLDKINKRE